jgi:hypothetical protein
MLSESEVREWRDIEKSRVDAIVNPWQRRKQELLLDVLNAVLQEG